MDKVSPACWAKQSLATDQEKENLDQIVAFGKSANGLKLTGQTGVKPRFALRHPLLGLYPCEQGEAALASAGKLHTAAPTHSKDADVPMSSSPELLTPIGASTPLISPHLKELSSSPASAQASPAHQADSRTASAAAISKPHAGTAPDASATDRVTSVSMTPKLGAAPGQRTRTNPRALLRLRVRRALTLQAEVGDIRRPACTARSACSKSVGDLNLSGARLQSAARINLSRSADWPASSAACIRKRTEEGTGYEMPNKSSKHDGHSRSLQSAADCLAQMCLKDKAHHVKSDTATVTAHGAAGMMP